ncbi:hypothetical protein B0H13DRAFT_1867527 [Mycena leptocephala]|nr:hypothetical protein B0H13DRAFT_1867527 [Mycena leptocephala]
MVTALVGHPPLNQHHAVPSTPKGTHPEPPNAVVSPTFPSPTKLPRFLVHAEENLGIPTARTFEAAMRENGYGPDIMHLLEDQALVDCGMTKGDALRIKAGAVSWWNGPDAKRKRVEEETGMAGPSQPRDDGPTTPPNKKVSFERRFEGDGATRFWGPRITPAKGGQSEADKNTWLLAAGSWIPMPLGYRAVEDFEGEEQDDEEDGGF